MEQEKRNLNYEGRWLLFKHYLARLAIRNLCTKADSENEYEKIFAINNVLKDLKTEMDRLEKIDDLTEEFKMF